MTINNLYIFDRDGTMLYYCEWQRKKNTNMSKVKEVNLLVSVVFLKQFTFFELILLQNRSYAFFT
jgi:hypothetical protein